MEIIIKSFNGIGDLLFVTPTLHVVKEAYPNARITVNTNYPELLLHNPFVDVVGQEDKGVFLGYADPIHAVHPTKHHIMADWDIVCREYKLITDNPDLRPEIYCVEPVSVEKREKIGVQIAHKGHWHNKKVWPHFRRLIREYPSIEGVMLDPIPHCNSMWELVQAIASYKMVVVAEGGVGHIAKAMGVPAVVIYGGFARPEWNGYPYHINLCHYPRNCGSPCYHPRECDHKYEERWCMKFFTVDMVADQIAQALIRMRQET